MRELIYLRPPMYKVIRKLLFLFPPEAVHHFSMNMLKMCCSISVFRKWITRTCQPALDMRKTFWNLNFINPVGMGAGFDKNALYLRELQALGFGFVEIGTVTPKAQAGNEQPRLFRLPADQALINRMGFNNDGADAISKRLKAWKVSQTESKNRMIIGGNIGKNKQTANEDAWKDYETCFYALADCVDYFVVNVSSPNTPGLRELQEKEALRKILSHLQLINKTQHFDKPILLKIAPDLNKEQLDDVIELALDIQLDGLVISNTTISRDALVTDPATVKAIGAGGLSGKPLQEKSTQVLAYVYKQTNGRIPIIGSGGIFCGKDASRKITAGAGLVQVWTGFIYEGPLIVKRICNDLKTLPQTNH